MMETIELPICGLVLQVDRENPGGGSIQSDLHEIEATGTTRFNAAMDGIESLILAHACAGIDVTTPAYLEGIETAVQSCANNIY